MAANLMDGDLFSAENVGALKKSETFQSSINKRQDQQQVNRAVAPSSRVQVTTKADAAQAPPAPQKPLSIAELKTLANSYATETVAQEKQYLDSLVRRIEQLHSVYKLERKHKNGPKTIPDAQEELAFVTLQLNKMKGMGMVNTMYYGLMNTLEAVMCYKYNPLGIQVQGLGKRLEARESELAPILVDIAVKYNLTMEANPLLQLLIVTGGIVKELHTENSKGQRSMYSAAPDISSFSADLGI